MTIKEYINIHTNSSFVKNEIIIIQPFSLCEKDHYAKQKALSIIYQKQQENKSHLTDELCFYNVKKLVEKVDLNIIIKKVKVDYLCQYSNDADVATTFYISDAEFIRLSKLKKGLL